MSPIVDHEHLHELVLATIAEGVVVHALDGVVSCNPAASEILELDTDQIAGRRPAPDGWGATDRTGRRLDRSEHPAHRALATGRPVVDQLLCVRRPRQGLAWLRVNAIPLSTGPNGLPDRVVSTFVDVTAEHELEAQAQTAVESMRLMADATPIGMFATDDDGQCTYVNPAWQEIFGLTPEEAAGDGWAGGIHPEDRPAVFVDWNAAAASSRDFHMTFRVCRPDGSISWVRARAGRVTNRQGALFAFMGVVQDVTAEHEATLARTEAERELQHLADHDDLTGLLNRRSFGDALDRHVEHCRRHRPTGALLLIDLDHFKRVNDTLGHAAGDKVIVAVANVLSDRMRSGDQVARLGGDEYAVLAPSCAPDRVATLADELIRAIRSLDLPLSPDRHWRTTASIGVTRFEDLGVDADADAALAAADGALYDAKARGRDRHAISGSAPIADRSGQRDWTARIETAIVRGGLQLDQQAVSDATTGATSCHVLSAALLDNHGERVPASRWLAAATRTGLARSLDRWLCQEALAHLSTSYTDLGVITLSAAALTGRALMHDLASRLEAGAIDPKRLTIQINEADLLGDVDASMSFMSQVRQLGCGFGVDEFAASFGNLRRLRGIIHDHLVVSPTLVAAATTDAGDRALLRGIVDAAGALDVEVWGATSDPTIAALGFARLVGPRTSASEPVVTTT